MSIIKKSCFKRYRKIAAQISFLMHVKMYYVLDN